MLTEYLLDMQPGLWKVIAATASGNTDRFIHDPMGIAQHEGNSGDWHWMAKDGLGTVRGIYDNLLAEAYTADRDPYGELINSSGVNPTPYEYTGEMRDANDLQYHRARYLDPSLGVWISEDPVETANRYAYVGGDPINNVDPGGLSACKTGSAINGSLPSYAGLYSGPLNAAMVEAVPGTGSTTYQTSSEPECDEDYYTQLKGVESLFFGRTWMPQPGERLQPSPGECRRLESCLRPRIFQAMASYSNEYFFTHLEGVI